MEKGYHIYLLVDIPVNKYKGSDSEANRLAYYNFTGPRGGHETPGSKQKLY